MQSNMEQMEVFPDITTQQTIHFHNEAQLPDFHCAMSRWCEHEIQVPSATPAFNENLHEQ